MEQFDNIGGRRLVSFALLFLVGWGLTYVDVGNARINSLICAVLMISVVLFVFAFLRIKQEHEPLANEHNSYWESKRNASNGAASSISPIYPTSTQQSLSGALSNSSFHSTLMQRLHSTPPMNSTVHRPTFSQRSTGLNRYDIVDKISGWFSFFRWPTSYEANAQDSCSPYDPNFLVHCDSNTNYGNTAGITADKYINHFTPESRFYARDSVFTSTVNCDSAPLTNRSSRTSGFFYDGNDAFSPMEQSNTASSNILQNHPFYFDLPSNSENLPDDYALDSSPTTSNNWMSSFNKNVNIIYLCEELGVEIMTVISATHLLQVWLSQKLLRSLVKEINVVENLFSLNNEWGMSSLNVIANRHIEQFNQTSSISSPEKTYVPAARTILAFLSVSADKLYVMRRIKDLAASNCLNCYNWNRGSEDVTFPWRPTLPTDAELIMHFFMTFLDLRLLCSSAFRTEGLPFTEKHFVTSMAQIPDACGSFYIYQAQLSPPHYDLIIKGKLYKVPPGRFNVFYTIVFMLYYIVKHENQMLDYVHVNDLGLDIHLIFEK